MRNDFVALRDFARRYWFWLILLIVLNATTWLALEQYGYSGATDKWAIRMYLLSALLLFDNLCVLWWYAHSTRELVVATQQQLVETRHQTSLARAAQVSTELEAYTRAKPVVLTELAADGTHYLIRNVGGGPALNMYWLSRRNPMPQALGGLGVGQERMLIGWAQNDIHAEPQPWSHILVAEGIRTRTRRWNPTLNGGLTHTRLVAHDLFDHGEDSRMWDDRDLTLDQYLARWREWLTERLETFVRTEVADENV